MENRSYFDGGLLSYIGWIILGSLLTSCTFGICYPWALCMIYGWKINHTVIEGRRLKFNGTAVGLFINNSNIGNIWFLGTNKTGTVESKKYNIFRLIYWIRLIISVFFCLLNDF